MFFVSIPYCFALTDAGGSRSAPPSSAASPKMNIIVEDVIKITGDTIYLKNKKQYSLSGVSVVRQDKKTMPNKVRKAKMVFVNNVLKKVTLFY